MSREFNNWWEEFRQNAHFGNADEEAIKKIAWLSWRQGRELLHEELIHLRLQPVTNR